jgi:hypothetical protein
VAVFEELDQSSLRVKAHHGPTLTVATRLFVLDETFAPRKLFLERNPCIAKMGVAPVKSGFGMMYWVKLVVGNFYGAALLLIAVGDNLSGLLGQTKPNWPGVAVIWALGAGLILLSVYRTRRSWARQVAQLNAALPERISFTNDGVKWDGPNGATGFVPWRNFKGCREGRRVILVDQRDGNRAVMLPVAQMSEIDRLPIRHLLQSQIRLENQ